MVKRSYNAIIERNVEWNGVFETEPYEVGWASEAIFFIRSLGGSAQDDVARVQITPDGMIWCDESTQCQLPRDQDVTFCKVSHFGNWLRLAGETRSSIMVLVTLSLKE